jgi:regulator of protease activity HflC (stomatin/prohibitin superfamily)
MSEEGVQMLYVAIFVIPLIAMFIFASVKMIPQYERGIVFRMGKVTEPKGPRHGDCHPAC